MAHQSEIEKIKCRNFFRGCLAYKYLKQGIEGFADDVVLQEHNRILRVIGHTAGVTCNRCYIRSFRPMHKPITGKCPWNQTSCSCLSSKKKPCPNKVCDLIMEEILIAHASAPPTPNWKNTDMPNWCSSPWAVAKCFINAHGYSTKTSASDIDAPGLLHIFINNLNLQSHLSCVISGLDVFSKALKRRNAIFHSPKMELEDTELSDCIQDIIAILEDDKELKQRPEAQQAVMKLNELKERDFIITTHNEVEVCRDAMMSIKKRSEELQDMIKDAKADIEQKRQDTCEGVDDKSQKALDAALEQLEQQNSSQFQSMKHAIRILSERLKHVETESSATKLEIISIKQRLTEIESNVEKLEVARSEHEKHLLYVQQKQDLQIKIVELYEESYIKTWISPLKTQDNNIDINEVYVTPRMVVRQEIDKPSESTEKPEPNRLDSSATADYIGFSFSNQQQHGPSISGRIMPGRLLYRSPRGQHTEQPIEYYSEIFQTDGRENKKIFIIGDVGTGKSSLSKMMIYNWCRAVRNQRLKIGVVGQGNGEILNSSVDHNELGGNTRYIAHDPDEMYKSITTEVGIQGAIETNKLPNLLTDNIAEMDRFEFLFVVPLQTITGYCSDLKEMVQILYKHFMEKEVLERIFNEGSERCLIVADGLDEWSPPSCIPLPLHVSHGLPIRDGVKDATVVTLSRSSAKGIINLKSTECDQKIELLGVPEQSISHFVKMYLQKLDKTKRVQYFFEKISAIEIEHLEQTPLILQQLIWMYCEGKEIGNSSGEIYSNILNIMFAWSEKGAEIETLESGGQPIYEWNDVQLPPLLMRFPRCEENQRIVYLLGKACFQALTKDVTTNAFGRSKLHRCGLTKNEIATFVKCGILVECTSFDPTIERTYLSFIHMSYLEFFAAIYIASHNPNTQSVIEMQETTHELFTKFTSAEDILKLSNLLKMICRLRPCLLWDITAHIARRMENDSEIIRNRSDNTMRTKSGFFKNIFVERKIIIRQIQGLVCTLYLECGADDYPVNLCDVEFGSRFPLSIIDNIVPESVLSTYLITSSLKEDIKMVSWILKVSRLQYIRIEGYRDCKVLDQLAVSLSYVTSLKKLYFEDLRCDFKYCKGHFIDLSKHDQLKSIILQDCSCMVGAIDSSGTITQLEDVYIKFMPSQQIPLFTFFSRRRRTPHVHCERLESYLSQAVSLKHLTVEDIICVHGKYEGHFIDLSKHDQLKSICIKNCSCMIGAIDSSGTTSQLEQVYIKDMSSGQTPLDAFYSRIRTPQVNWTSHVHCERFVSYLSQSVSLKHLTLEGITCVRENCEGHFIDLSKHGQLTSICITNCSCMIGAIDSSGTTSQLKNVYMKPMSSGQTLLDAFYLRRRTQQVNWTSHVHCERFVSYLSQSVSLKHLTLEDITCVRENCEGHFIDLSKHDQLTSICIKNCSCMIGVIDSSGTTSQLENVYIKYMSSGQTPPLDALYSRRRTPQVNWTSHVHCERFVSYLSQSVSLKHLTLEGITCVRENCEGHFIDLSKHGQLKSICIKNCSCMIGAIDSSGTTSQLEKVYMKPNVFWIDTT